MTATDSDTAARARALLDADTQEEWEAFTSQDEWYVGSMVARNDEGKPMVWRPVCEVDGDNPEALAALIAAAPTLITDLLADRNTTTDSDTDEVNRLLSDIADLAAERDAAVARADKLETAIGKHLNDHADERGEQFGCCSDDEALWSAAFDRGTDR